MSKIPEPVATAALLLWLAACALVPMRANAAAPGFDGRGDCAESSGLRCRVRAMPVGAPVPLFAPLPASNALGVADVQRIVSQAVGEAQARSARATIAVVDRVGNVLVVFRMDGASTTFRIASGRNVSGGLEGVNVLADSFAAISKAITGAYLSSNGNAFSTRSAGQIVQENFNPREFSQPSGPLFGVQFSQLSCSDLMRRDSDAMLGPKRSPLGLSADAGGLPLYKAGILVGGIGVISDGLYSLDLDISNFDTDIDELIAVAGAAGWAAPVDIRANRIALDGRTLRYVDSEALRSAPAASAPFASLPGSTVVVAGYADGGVHAGVALGTAASGIRSDSGAFAYLSGHVLVDAGNNNRYPPIVGGDGLLGAAEVSQLLRSALDVANRARAQIRRPAGSAAQVSITVVDTLGNVLGLVRSPDAPVFGIDVALQKARSAALFSSFSAGAALQSLPPAQYLAPPAASSVSDYVNRLRSFLGKPAALSDGLAYSTRAIGNLSRPYFPDGIANTPNGPLSKAISAWSPFNDGLQLDLVYNAFVAGAGGDPLVGCSGLPQLRNGLQIFPGAVPIYRGNQLLGAIGVSGDGVDQDDMIAFLGLANAGLALGTGIGNAPAANRADTLVPAGTGTRLRYVQCPQAPFNNSTEQNVCAGF